MERITTSFGFGSTAAEVIEGVDLSGKCAIVTGGASGIGLETAKALSAAGAAVTLAVRRPAAARAVAEDLRVSTGNDTVEVRFLDGRIWLRCTNRVRFVERQYDGARFL